MGVGGISCKLAAQTSRSMEESVKQVIANVKGPAHQHQVAAD